MIAESGEAQRTIAMLFGPQAEFVKVRRQHVEIRLDGITLGQGATFKQALQVALRSARTTGGAVVKASSMLPAERSGVRATAEPSSTSIALRDE